MYAYIIFNMYDLACRPKLICLQVPVIFISDPFTSLFLF